MQVSVALSACIHPAHQTFWLRLFSFPKMICSWEDKHYKHFEEKEKAWQGALVGIPRTSVPWRIVGIAVLMHKLTIFKEDVYFKTD